MPRSAPSRAHAGFAALLLLISGAIAIPLAGSAVASPTNIQVSTSAVDIVDSTGSTWMSRRGFTGGFVSSGTDAAIDIRNTADDVLYRTAFYGMSRWTSTVPAAGQYDVTLKMTENYHKSAGSRVFDVWAEGVQVASAVDIFKSVGRYAAYDIKFRTTVADGRLDVSFVRQIDNPIVSAIAVTPVAPNPTPTPSTAAPSPTPTPPSPTTSPTPTPEPGSRAGASPMSELTYPVPAGAVVASPWGNDSAPGTVERPVKTVAAAIQKAADGGTVVMRAGRYHESVIVPPGRRLTIQPYPKEHAWFDGSKVVSGWKADGDAWRAPWGVRFDRSPTYYRGAPDNTVEYWRFVGEEFPLAAHPEMLWIDGVAQRQVASRSQVRPGAFFVDDATRSLILGADPTGRTVEASALQTAISLRAPGTMLRGIGVRRYGSAVPDQGVVTSYFPGMTLENVVVEDSGTGGIGFFAEKNTIRSSTIRRSGQLALQAGRADDLTIDRVLIESANNEGFNTAPAAGGIKVTSSRRIVFTNSRIVDTRGHAFWVDESVYDTRTVGNDIIGATGNGIYFELSAKGIIANNQIEGIGADGISLRNTNQVQVWNNTIRSRTRALDISQDYRKASNLSEPGHDTRLKLPDPTMTWIFGDIHVRNNVMEGGGDALILFGVQSYDHEYDASAQNITSNGNVFGWPAPDASPRWLVAWSRIGKDPSVYTDLGAFASARGQERTGHLRRGASVFDSAGRLDAQIANRSAVIAEGLPAQLAAVTGKPAGTRHLGAWR